jgi:hypothetical protein
MAVATSQSGRPGGRIVVAPQAARTRGDVFTSPRVREIVAPTSVLQELGLPKIETRIVDLSATSDLSSTSSGGAARYAAEDSDDEAPLRSYFSPQLFPTTSVSVDTKGGLAEIGSGATKLIVPCEVQVLDLDKHPSRSHRLPAVQYAGAQKQ